jgi:hypothetical protein
MPQGLQVWNAAGQLTLDTGTRISRLHGSFLTTSGAGSIILPSLAQGDPFFLLTVPSFNPSDNNYARPTITRSGTTISWTGGVVCRVFYGAF